MMLAFVNLIPVIIWAVIKMAIVMAISYGVGLLLRKKPQGVKPAGADSFQLPTASEGRPLPVVSGTREVKSPNAITPLLQLLAIKKKHQDVTVAYYYRISLMLGVCQAHVDGIKRFRVADTVVWPTLNAAETLAEDGQTTATVNASECWGGYEREGGVSGEVHIQYGASDQALDSWVESLSGSSQPAYQGMTSITLCWFYIGTQPILKPWAVMTKRTDHMTDGSDMWYAAKSKVILDGETPDSAHLNAVHFLYERFFCPITGLGKSTGLVGDSWEDAADTCYAEGYGISNVWDWADDDLETMVETVEAVIDGKVYYDPATGKYEVALVRYDYDEGSLDEYGEDDFWVESMASGSPGKIPSRTIVTWFDRWTNQPRPAEEPDIAILARQGGAPIVQEIDYSGFVCSPALAAKISAREQTKAAAMPKLLTLRALRTMAHLHETDVIKITYPALNITSMIVRVLAIDRGSLAEGECLIDVMEDIFGQSYTTFGSTGAGASPAAEEMEDRMSDLDDYSEIFITTSGTENAPH